MNELLVTDEVIVDISDPLLKEIEWYTEGFQTFKQLKAEYREKYLQNGTLFEDPYFPCKNSSITYSNNKDYQLLFKWERPQDIKGPAKFFVGGVNQFDIKQGILGDCWLLAAMANITLNKDLFAFVVPPDQSFEEDYAGIFHFRFWQYGKWVDVHIDDRLPTINGKLVFLHSSEPNEYWSALMEKAYAKLHGSYEALTCGKATEALQDFTGGVTKTHDLKNNLPSDLFEIMFKALNQTSFMCASIKANPEVKEQETPQGLVRGHAYSVTKLDRYRPYENEEKIALIRLRNPWGRHEWIGDWSDTSAKCVEMPESRKQELSLQVQDDGEFWMSFDDFKKYFDEVQICTLDLNTIAREPTDWQQTWDRKLLEGEWIPDQSAGGCLNDIKSFSCNPKYYMTLRNPEEENVDDLTVIIALMQKHLRVQRCLGVKNLFIGFAIYRLGDLGSKVQPLDPNFFEHNDTYVARPPLNNVREITHHYRLSPGVYCIIPYTYNPSEHGKFVLRIFTTGKVEDSVFSEN